jgi:hypothetical protein
MSRGPGIHRRRIAELLAATRDRALGIDEITDHAFALAGAPPTRAQRLSATRAAHGLLRRVRDTTRYFEHGMKDVYQHCKEKHLHRYLAEFDFR